MECIRESSLGLGEVPAVITAIAVGTQRQFQAYFSNLETLDLYGTKLSNQSVFAIAETLKVNTTITVLLLCQSQISDQGATAIANALKINNTVEAVALVKNEISDQGAIAIAEALRLNTTIEYVTLWNNQISYQVFDQIRISDR